VALVPGLDEGDLVRLREFRLDRVGQVLAWTLPQLEVVFAAAGTSFTNPCAGSTPRRCCRWGRAPRDQRRPRLRQRQQRRRDAARGAVCAGRKSGRKLRQRRLAAQRLGIVLDYSDGMRVARQGSLAPASANDQRLFELAQGVLDRAWTRRVRIRHLRLCLDRLTFPPAQLDLFADRSQPIKKDDRLMQSLDAIRGKFGAAAVGYGRIFS
jgi:DNA polymerase-4